MTAAHAHAFHGARPAQLPNKIEAIRAALSAEQRPKFQAELDEAIDKADLNVIDEVKGKWWALAMWEYDPTIREAFEAIDRGEAEFFPSPFTKR